MGLPLVRNYAKNPSGRRDVVLAGPNHRLQVLHHPIAWNLNSPAIYTMQGLEPRGKLSTPMPSVSLEISFAVWNEIFMVLNSTDAGIKKDLNQNWIFAEIGYHLNNKP